MGNYVQVTSANRSTKDLPGWCARFVFNAFGGKNGWGFSTAIDAWNGQKNRHPGELPPAGVDVPIWFSWTKDPRGHTAVFLSDGRVMSSPVSPTPWTARQDIFPSIAALMAAFGGGMKYLGWGEQMDGTVVVKLASLEAHQRMVGPVPAIRRAEPTRQSAAVPEQLAKNSIGNFDGWILGENIEGNAIWYRGKPSGNWFWSGSFTSQSTDGLADLNPKTPVPSTGKRQVKPDSPVLIRELPTTQSKAPSELAAGTIIAPAGYAVGEEVYGSSIWYKVEGGWSWAGAFTDASTNGLTKLPTPETPAPEPSVPDYVMFEAFSSCVTEVLPAHSANYEVGRFSPDQYEAVLHDFGTDGKDTFAGTKSHFRNKNSGTSSHFVVSGKHIVQMVSLQNRAWHAGPSGNDRIGIEIDPAVGRVGVTDELRNDTIKSVITLLLELDLYYKKTLGLRKHPEFMATQCGDDVDLLTFFNRYDVTPEPEPEPQPDPKLDQILQMLTDQNTAFESVFRVTV